MKHTPGPWTHAPLSEDVIGPRGQGVCSPCDGYDEDQWPVDARLIAAAPDLLKVSQAASHALRSYEFGNASTELAKSVADAIDIAIAKAEGRYIHGHQSACPCGCDPGEGYTCEQHRTAVQS